MILAVARRELALQLRDGRMVLAGLALLAALAASAGLGATQFLRGDDERARFAAEARQQWLEQGPKHPHRAAHFGAYVAKPEFSLALFEPGLRPFAGQTLWLEAHDRAAFANVPAEDDLSVAAGLGATSASSVLLILGGLLALVLGALGVVREREAGVLRQVLAQGGSPGAWLAGKFVGLGAALALPLAPAAGLAVGFAVAVSPPALQGDVLARGLLLIGADMLFLGALLALGLVISAQARSARTALMVALSVWVSGFVLAPRLAAALAEAVAPVPTLADYQKAAGEVFAKGYDGKPGYDARLAALEAETLKRYGVAKLSDLPIGFSGLRMKMMDLWSAEVDDRAFQEVEARYRRQAEVRALVSVAAPFVAARSLSQGLAGMDWPHYRHFAAAAEEYRRGFGAQMNALIEHGVTGETWEMDGQRADWAQVAAFDYRPPDAGWAVQAQASAVAVLLGWGLAVTLLLAAAARRLKP